MKEGTDTESRHADADHHPCCSMCAPVSAFGNRVARNTCGHDYSPCRGFVKEL